MSEKETITAEEYKQQERMIEEMIEIDKLLLQRKKSNLPEDFWTHLQSRLDFPDEFWKEKLAYRQKP